jgi:hypothetical protein
MRHGIVEKDLNAGFAWRKTHTIQRMPQMGPPYFFDT